MPRLVYLYPWQEIDAIDVYVDTDWAGCARTRKSTSGGCVMFGRHMIKSLSSTQPGVTLGQDGAVAEQSSVASSVGQVWASDSRVS